MVDRLAHGTPLSQLLKGLGDVPSHHDPVISGIQIDSRKVMPGDAFLALRGHREHGVAYVNQAIAAGAGVILVDMRDVDRITPEQSRAVFFITDLDAKAGEIAHRFYGGVTDLIKTLGVTGTNGKTSVSCFIAQAIDQLVSLGTCGVIGTLGQGLLADLQETGMTTPDVVSLHQSISACHDKGAQAIVIEASSHGLDQGRLNGVQFDVAIFTNLTRDHLDYHPDMQHYGEAKSRLFAWEGLGTAVINADDDFAQNLIVHLKPEVTCISYTLNPESLHPGVIARSDRLLVAEHVTSTIAGLSLRIRCGEETALCRVPVLGQFNASNLLAALGGLMGCGFAFQDAVQALSRISGVNGRMELIKLPELPAVVVDFAHTPDGLEKALASLRPLCEGELWCVVGCGGDRDRGKRALMASTVESLADRVVLTSDNPRTESPNQILDDMQSGLKQSEQIVRQVDRQIAIRHAIRQANKTDVILIAGKGHEAWQEIQGEKLPFSDRAVALAQLQQLAGDTA